MNNSKNFDQNPSSSIPLGKRFQTATEKNDATLIDEWTFWGEPEDDHKRQRMADLMDCLPDESCVLVYHEDAHYEYKLYYFHGDMNNYLEETELNGFITVPKTIRVPDEDIETDNPNVEDLLEARKSDFDHIPDAFTTEEDPDKYTIDEDNNLVGEGYIEIYTLDRMDTIREKLHLPEPNPHIKSEPKVLTTEDLIEQGENEHLEFKKTFLYDIYQDQPNKELKDDNVIEIAAMANSKGGKILFGVSDDQEITGLEKDYKVMNNREGDRDSFKGQLFDQTTELIGKQNAQDLISIDFKTISEKDVCIVRVKSSPEPVFYGDENKFYIRVQTSTKELDSKETNKYIQDHFN